MTDIKIKNLELLNEKLSNKILELEEKLKKYTNNERHKKYYEKNKEKIKERNTQYIERLKIENPEKLKEWRHKTYINRKTK